MSERDRKFMRTQLATIGIFLPEDAKPVAPSVNQVGLATPVDRDEIRAVLVTLGAPAKDLDWLVASCPGVEYALGYRPPRRVAWCIDCCGPTEQDDLGCVGCWCDSANLSHQRLSP